MRYGTRGTSFDEALVALRTQLAQASVEEKDMRISVYNDQSGADSSWCASAKPQDEVD